MGAITDEAAEVFRDYITDGVPASGAQEPVKADIRALFSAIETAMGNLSLGSVDVSYATRAALDADLAWAAASIGLVYADATDANNDLYVKVGGSGAGSWTLTTIIHDVIEGAAAPHIELARLWAEEVEDVEVDTGQFSALHHAAKAEGFADDAAASVVAAEAAVSDIINEELIQGTLPQGWIEPDDYTGITYRNDYGVKFYSNGRRVWTMLPDEAATLEAWRIGGVRVRNPDDGLYYVSVKMGLVKDPTLQGTAPIVIYVNNSTGNDTTGNGSEGTPYKTVEKAKAVIIADAVNDVFEVRLSTSTFIGGNAAGWNSNTQSFDDKRVKIIGVGATKPWWLPGMRNGYLKATFAWTDMGDGIWKCTTGSISAAAKNTKIVVDLSVLSADGMPTPSAYMGGPFADEAAILAAMAERPSFHNTALNEFYVKLASGDEPDPGVNFAYVELIVGNLFEIDEGGRLMIENIRAVMNYGNNIETGLMRFRPSTFTQGAAEPAVEHDVEVVLKDVENYGANADGFRHQSVARFIVQDCRLGLIREDGFDSSTLYTYPVNTNDTDEGLADHAFIDGLISDAHGDHEWRDQPAMAGTGNFITGHSQTWTTATNCRCRDTQGSSLAFVGGARCLALNCNPADPQEVTPGIDVYQAPYLASGNKVGDTSYGSAIYGIHNTGSVRPSGKMFYVGPTADMVQAHFRGTVTKQVDSGGTLTDGYGNAL